MILPEQNKNAVWPFWPAALLFFLGWLICCAPWLAGYVTIPWDAKAHFQPQLQFLAQSLAAGESPFWTPYVFSGSPQIADPQSLIFSPPFFLLALINGAPGFRGTDAATFGALLIGGLAIVAYFRDRRWHWAGAVIAALIFSFGGSSAWRIQHVGQILSLGMLPVAFLCLTRALDRSSIVSGALAGLTAGLMVLGRDQVALLGVYVLLAWTITHWLGADNRSAALRASIRPLLAGAVIGAVVVTPPIVLTWLLAGQSNRPEIDFIGAGRGSLHPALLVTSFIPHLFGAAYRMEDYWGPPSFAWNDTGLYIAQNMGVLYFGAAPLILFLTAGLVRGSVWNREVRFFSIGLFASFLFALGWYTPVFRLMYEALPGVSFYRRPADATFIIGFFFSICAGWLVHRLFAGLQPRRRPWQRWAEVALIASPFLFALLLGLRIDRVSLMPVPMLWAALSFAAGLAVLIFVWHRFGAEKAHVAAFALIAVTTADLAFNNGPNGASALKPDIYDVLRPDSKNETIALLKQKVAATRGDDRRDRVELAALGFHWPNASLVHQLDNTLGYNPVRLGLYTRATAAQDHVALADQRKFSGLMASYRSPLVDMLGLRFIATGVPIEQIDKSIAAGSWPPLARTADGFIYENTGALPRVLFAPQAQKASFELMLTTGRWPAFDVRRTVLLENPPADSAAARSPGTVRIAAYHNTRIRIAVDSPEGGFVVLNDPYMPWWFATVDGVETPVLQANVLFRAVAVPPGRHVVEFRFRPLRGALADLRQKFGR
ncbi:MAG: hypothetical protein ACRCYS_04430 [Beijerinckiaceae bacterium]